MELLGTVHNGVVVPDDPAQLPQEGTRVRIEPVPKDKAATFGEVCADLIIDSPELPSDLASQHEHYRLGVAKR